MKRGRYNYITGQLGQDIVEFALVLPVLLLLLFGVIEFGRVFLTYNTLSNAAREGARHGIVLILPSDADGVCSGSPAGIVGAACRLTTGLNPAGVQVSVDVTAATVSVQVDYTLTLLVGPVIDAVGGSPGIPLSGRASMRREQ